MNRHLVVNILRVMNCALALGLTLCFGSGCLAVQTKQAREHTSQQISRRDPVRALDEQKAGTIAFRERKYREAQQHFEKSLALDSSQKIVPFLIARAIHAQYSPGVSTPENIAKGREAIAAYKKVLVNEPDHDEAYSAVSVIYGAMKDDAQQRAWILDRANRVNASKERRFEAYTTLAAQDLNCSNAITERPENKESAAKGDQEIIRFKKPKDQKDFETAKQCATSGLEFIEKAIRLNPDSELAWNQKTQLLLEMVKLAEMENRTNQQVAYKKRAAEAEKRTTELSEINRIKSEAVKPY